MKNTIINLAITIIFAFSANIALAQFSEGFEGTFYPDGWSGKGFSKSSSKKKAGDYSAETTTTSIESANPENYLKIDNMNFEIGTSVTISYTSLKGYTSTSVLVYVKNSSVNSGDSVLCATLNPGTSWSTSSITFPSAYNSTTGNCVYFVALTASPKKGIYDVVYIDDVYSDSPMPVEMEFFNYTVNMNNVNLKWKTTMEINNMGFEVELKNETQWTNIGFVPQDLSKNYNFTDKNLTSGTYQYRLKQIDYNGNYEYHNLNSVVTIETPKNYSLSQNYPNPFNPVTNIEFNIPDDGFVTLKVYDAAGKEVSVLVNENKVKGSHKVSFNASGLSSGIYFYKLEASTYSQVKKMTLIK
jgi:hypothetical protein